MIQNYCTSTLVVGISSTIRRLNALKKMNYPEVSGVEYLIVIQLLGDCGPKQAAKDVARIGLERVDIKIAFLEGAGVARNRNEVIRLSKGRFLWFADDDLVFTADALKSMMATFEDSSGSSLLAFKSSHENGRDRKIFSPKGRALTKFNSARFGTCEIAVRRKDIVSAGIQFDAAFGLGSKNGFGDEYIFISDCLKRGLTCTYVPITLASHPTESTGQRILENRLQSEVAIFKRVFGWNWLIWLCAFKLNKYIRKFVKPISVSLAKM